MRTILFSLALALASQAQAGTEPGSFQELLEKGADYRRQGNLHLAIEALEAARKVAADAAQAGLAAGELGATHLQARRLFDAGLELRKAYDAAQGADKARYAVDLGNLAAARKNQQEAVEYWRKAKDDPAAAPATAVSAALNLARVAPEKDRLQQLLLIDREIAKVASLRERVRFRLNLGAQARPLGEGALKLAYDNLSAARAAAEQLQDKALLAEALDLLAQLYEDGKRTEDALLLTDQAIAAAPFPESQGVLIQLEWRKGRLHRRLGQDAEALSAYQRAVQHIEGARQDIPVEYEDGRSSFRDTLEPIYLGLADLLLKQSATQPEKRADYLKRARDAVELIKQSELQDYLGDRCTVDSLPQGSQSASIPAGTAVLYPIILPDRLDLLLETGNGIHRHSIAATGKEVQQAALGLAAALRNGEDDFEKLSRQLYDWFLKPYEPFFTEQKLDTLVVVPDGALRLVPFSALHDGREYAIQKFAVATVPGLTMTQQSELARRGNVAPLLAGLSDPGPVVDKLLRSGVGKAVGTPAEEAGSASRGLAFSVRGLRSINAPGGLRAAGVQGQSSEAEKMRQRLALPGVKDEMETLAKTTQGQVILDKAFTAADFRRSVQTGNYNVVHIASHGLFGGSAETSFIMAYDDLITIDGLQALLKSDELKKNPIELVTLSACQTAEGDDRAPLGIAGAALKARARSALGTLWPVADDAAKEIMARFYAGLSAGKTKAQSLRESQAALIGNKEMEHPFYWAPFIMVGNWL